MILLCLLLSSLGEVGKKGRRDLYRWHWQDDKSKLINKTIL